MSAGSVIHAILGRATGKCAGRQGAAMPLNTPPVVSAIEASHLDHSKAHKHPPAPKTVTFAAVENVPAAPAPIPLVTEAPKAPETKGAPAIVRLAPVALFGVPVEQPPAPASVAAPLRLAPTPPIAATSEQQSQAATTARPPPVAARDARVNALPRPTFAAHPLEKTMTKSIIRLALVSWRVGPNASISYRLAKAQSAGG